MNKKYLFYLLFKYNKKASTAIKEKALAFWLSNSVKIIESNDKIVSIIFLRGYHKKYIKVEITDDKVLCLKKHKNSFRQCDAFLRNGVCSHVLATLYTVLKFTGYKSDEYKKLKKGAERFLKRWKVD